MLTAGAVLAAVAVLGLQPVAAGIAPPEEGVPCLLRDVTYDEDELSPPMTRQEGVAIADDGSFFVSDWGESGSPFDTGRIYVFDETGDQTDVIVDEDADPLLDSPSGMDVDGSGDLHVADFLSIHRFDSALDHEFSIGADVGDPELDAVDISAAPGGDVLLANSSFAQAPIMRLSSTGAVELEIQAHATSPPFDAITSVASQGGDIWATGLDQIYRFDDAGTLEVSYPWDFPNSIDVDDDGNVWFWSYGEQTSGFYALFRISPFGEITEVAWPDGGDFREPWSRIDVSASGEWVAAVESSGSGFGVARFQLLSCPFTDVGPTHPFFDDISWMDEQGISTGYQDGTYRPSAAVTRQAMSAFMYRLAGEPPFTPPASPTFTDVSTTHPFFDEVEWMADAGISEGYQPGPTYRPSAAVTRQAMSAFMHRLADGPGIPS